MSEFLSAAAMMIAGATIDWAGMVGELMAMFLTVLGAAVGSVAAIVAGLWAWEKVRRTDRTSRDYDL